MKRQFTFYHLVSRNSWYSFDRPWNDERLSRLWSHPVVLNMGPLDWESSTLTTRPLYVDDTIFSVNIGLIECIISVLDSFHKKIQFTCEVESNGEKSSSDVYLHCDFFMPKSWKRGILTILVDRAYLIHSTL